MLCVFRVAALLRNILFFRQFHKKRSGAVKSGGLNSLFFLLQNFETCNTHPMYMAIYIFNFVIIYFLIIMLKLTLIFVQRRRFSGSENCGKIRPNLLNSACCIIKSSFSDTTRCHRASVLRVNTYILHLLINIYCNITYFLLNLVYFYIRL